MLVADEGAAGYRWPCVALWLSAARSSLVGQSGGTGCRVDTRRQLADEAFGAIDAIADPGAWDKSRP
ncbi:hypothetical protein ACWKT5_26495 [Streptomyces avermitilis]